jgi:hypothetical protein
MVAVLLRHHCNGEENSDLRKSLDIVVGLNTVAAARPNLESIVSKN